MAYEHQKIESKWQKTWKKSLCFNVEVDAKKKKFYGLAMFPYPSGNGLHMGHLSNYVPLDVICRYKRACGFNVLQPIGYDAFGLPAEQYAIATGTHPEVSTNAAIANFKKQLLSLGLSLDWSREISTCDPKYYKWTQFIFLKLFEKGLAYEKEVLVNWCPKLKTVLANEEVIDGKSERGSHSIVRVPMKQWVLKITDYAERLLQDLDKINWPQQTKDMQAHWIGKSTGANIQFSCNDKVIQVFTTRADTLWGATYLALSPEHPLTLNIVKDEQRKAVEAYVSTAKNKSELSRKQAKEKTGVFTGSYGKNPLTGERLPIWIADYVLMDYGLGAIMCVPAHDERDFAFASKYKLPIKSILKEGTVETLPYTGEGKYINSDLINNMSSQKEAAEKVIDCLERKKLGKRKINYKLRDWLFSRQRYWGEPIPMVHYESGESRALDIDELPLELPPTKTFEPTEDGKPPLAALPKFLKYTHPQTGEKGLREVNTMPGSAGSSWYFLRYLDPHNDSEPVNFDKQKYWMPVDMYMGGTEHAVGHLLYARFWQKVLFDCELVSHDEPFASLKHQGVVMGEDGVRMSKSRGNVISPDDFIAEYGADACRLYILFVGPFEKEKILNLKGPASSKKFLDKVFSFYEDRKKIKNMQTSEIPEDLLKLCHQTLKKVSSDFETMQINTAISALMIFTNRLQKESVFPLSILKIMAQMLMPLCPHLSEEMWQLLGQKGLVSTAPWPTYDAQLAVKDEVEIGVQINGKKRDSVILPSGASEKKALLAINNSQILKKYIENKQIVKIIYRENKILNLIVK